MKKFIIIFICFINVLVVNAQVSRAARNVKVGDTFTLYTTNHSYTHSVMWNWDTALFELQGNLTGYSTSATFKAIKESPAVGSTIQATTYYYKNGTTSSGINKDVDTWKIFVNGDGGSSDNTKVSMRMSSLSLGKGQTTNILAYASSNSYSGNYSWTTSNSSIIKILEQVGPKVSIKAVGSGSASLKVTLDNGNSDSLSVVVKDDENDSGDNGNNGNSGDNTQNGTNYNETDYYYQISKKRMDVLRNKAIQQHTKTNNHE